MVAKGVDGEEETGFSEVSVDLGSGGEGWGREEKG